MKNTHENPFGRRTLIKALALFSLAPSVISLAPRSAHAASAKPKVLIAYFSHSGNTRAVAQMIHAAVGGDLLEIKAQQAYSQEYALTERRARQEFDSNARPALATAFPADMGSYDVIFVGYPNWFKTAPMPVFTFLEQYKFANKTLVPFTTHGGNGLANGPRDMAKSCPQATMLQGLAVSGSRASSAKDTVAQWLQSQPLLAGLMRK